VQRRNALARAIPDLSDGTPERCELLLCVGKMSLQSDKYRGRGHGTKTTTPTRSDRGWSKPYQARSVHRSTADIPRPHRHVRFVPNSEVESASFKFPIGSVSFLLKLDFPSQNAGSRLVFACCSDRSFK
jgi:hypothetical protein